MKKKINKKLLNLIALCSGITATVGLGVGGVIYSLRQEKDGGDEPIDQNILPESVYEIDKSTNELKGFKDAFLNDPASPIYKDNFKDCDTMEIPAKVTNIADYAFYHDTKYETTIPSFIKNLTFAEGSSCSSIGEEAFEECPLTSVIFSSSLTAIGLYAFCNCISLTSIDLSNCTHLSSIGNYAFTYCELLKSISFPDGLRTIDSNAFDKCSVLTSVNLSNCTNLSLINKQAFCRCSSLTSITFPNSLTTIGNYAFGSCTSIASITFPSSLTTIDAYAFNDCPKLNHIEWKSWTGSINLSSTSFKGVCPTDGTVTVTNPSGHDDLDLLQYLVKNGGLPESWLPAPELPDDVYIIENNILKGFTSEFLANPSAYRLCDTMEIPARVKEISEEAFYTNSTSTIPSFIKNLTFAEGSNCSLIGNRAFYKSLLTSVKLPSALITIQDSVFEGCSTLTSVDFSNATNLSSIGSYSFGMGPTMVTVDLSKCSNLTEIQSSAFRNNNALTSISLPSSLTSLSNNTFSDCPNLSSIEWNAWNGNTGLSSSSFVRVCLDGGTVTVTNPVDDDHNSDALLQYLLENGGLPSTWAKDVAPANALPYEVYEIEETTNVLLGFKEGIDLTQYDDGTRDTMEIPARVTSIGNNAFWKPSQTSPSTIPSFIKNLTFAENSNCSSIGDGAFYSCSSLTSIAFPSSLTEIDYVAFYNPSNLSSITWNAWKGSSQTIIDSQAFKNFPTTGTVTVINPVDGNDSAKLLQFLKDEANLPDGWITA